MLGLRICTPAQLVSTLGLQFLPNHITSGFRQRKHLCRKSGPKDQTQGGTLSLSFPRETRKAAVDKGRAASAGKALAGPREG